MNLQKLISDILKIPEFEKLIGDNSDTAWQERERLEKKEPLYVAISLTGISSEESRKWLNNHKEIQKLWWGICWGLIGDESEEAWQVREYLRFDKKVKRPRGIRWTLFKKFLGLHKSKRLFNLRVKVNKLIGNKFLGWMEPGDVVISTTGLDTERAWDLRNEFENIAPAEVLISLADNFSDKAQKLREKYKRDKKLRWALEISTRLGPNQS